jgi:hypothetical protein
MKFIRSMAKYTRKDYKTNEEILSVPKINPVVNKIQNYLNTLVQHVLRMDGDRQTDILKYEICIVWGNEAKYEHSKDF